MNYSVPNRKERYGSEPKMIGVYQVDPGEMMFYQDLPIKLSGDSVIKIEDRLKCFDRLIGAACCDFIGSYGIDRYCNSYIYTSAKRLFQSPGCSFNRLGYHCDGFMTDDINYIWSDKNPTIFNKSLFNLTQDDKKSMQEMKDQALPYYDFHYLNGSLLRLNQFNVHRTSDVDELGVRTFLKISFSLDKYDLIGNSHNYLLDYRWNMRPRGLDRNIPKLITP